MLRLDLPDTDNLAAAAGALSPRIWDDLVAFNGAARTHARLSGREFEAARYRIALINDCNLCQSRRGAPGEEEGGAGIPESFYEAVTTRREDQSPFSERESLAIEFAERFALDHIALHDDEVFWDRLHASFSDPELVDLGLVIAGFIGGGRFHRVFGTDSVCMVDLSARNA
ncbi:hypothetical protein AXA44_07620 [Rhodococcus sp. SC4]|nr:hypothetical protein AXA44_07620 [Rhodococcus sp. SC4]